MLGVESLEKLGTMSEMRCRLPTIVASVIALPFDKVLELIAVLSTVKYLVNLIF